MTHSLITRKPTSGIVQLLCQLSLPILAAICITIGATVIPENASSVDDASAPGLMLQPAARITNVDCMSRRVVNTTAGNGAGTLRQAVADVCANGTVVFSPAVFSVALTITLAPAGQIEIDKSLTIDGADGGVVEPTISGNGSTRVFQVDGGAQVVLNKLIIRNGYCNGCNGGGIYNSSVLSITNGTLISNSANSGGGVYNSNEGALTVTSVDILSNQAVIGGGIYNDGEASVSGSYFGANTATGSETATASGGGFYNNNVLNVHGSMFSHNNANSGAGIWNGGALSTTDVEFFDNEADETGGGILNSGQATIVNSSLVYNSAGLGGGMLNEPGGVLTVTNSTLYGNSALWNGGLYNRGAVRIINSTLTSNNDGSAISGHGDGSAVGNHGDGLVFLVNTILDRCDNDSSSLIEDGGHNLDSGTSCGFGLYDVTHSLSNTDPLLGPLASYGSATLLLGLTVPSPAVRAGDPAACPATDERGMRRHLPASCDIGAFESNWNYSYLPFTRH